ncbi:MAG: 1-deoxy-D-xylulose-5-phosphate reductoisomerase [Planctomycetota bacterium]|nr:MAG: 1-deoxy-D-xylulose-5-phosphate reductoisomerase [Planctomycetota bacterium]
MGVAHRRLVILGATGTVGCQALDLLERAGSPLRVLALSAHRREAPLRALAARCPGAAMFLTSRAEDHERLLELLLAGDYDVCLQAMVGAAGLPFSAAVLGAGRHLALANKESLVLAGGILMELAARTGAVVVPVDSEHSAIHQCLAGRARSEVKRLYLTASGGALRDLPLCQLESVTPVQALAHPNWSMGPRITVDSATMMNKAFEILEAEHLFGVPARHVRVLQHRQSVVHSLVELVDGSVLAQMGPPDMSFPIHYALHYPARVPAPLEGYSPRLFAQLNFEEPDPERYPALALGWRAAELGGAAGAVLNAADEVAVAGFLEGQLPYSEIPSVCAETLDALPPLPAATLADIAAADAWARQHARALRTALR